MHYRQFNQDDETERNFQELIAPGQGKEVYSVVNPDDDSPVGVAMLRNIDLERGTATCLLLVMNPEARTRELCVDAIKSILARAFEGIGLREVYINMPVGVFKETVEAFLLCGAMRLPPSLAFNDGRGHGYDSLHVSRDAWFRIKFENN